MNLIEQAWRMTWRDWRAGELRLLVVSLALAVAAVTSVEFFVDRLRLGFARDATQLLGADLVVVSDNPIPEAWSKHAHQRGLRTAQTVIFPSVVQHPTSASLQLSAIKAVSDDYPLRGKVGTEPPLQGIPAAGTVWVDEQLTTLLNVRLGDSLVLGHSLFRISGMITSEPDRGANFINFAPRVLMRFDELGNTGLIQLGSRVNYRLLVASRGPSEPTAEIRQFRDWVKTQLTRGQRIESLESGRPEMQQALQRAEQFLSLITLLTVLLAAVAVALAARRYSTRHMDAYAVLRCLGSSQRTLMGLFAGEFFIVGTLASVVGGALGFVTHFVLLLWTPTPLPWPSALPLLKGLTTGLALLAGFALPPLLALRHVSPLRVWRRDFASAQPAALLAYGLGALVFLGLLLWFAGDLKLGISVGIAFLIIFTTFILLAWVGLYLTAPLRHLGGRTSVVFRFAFAGTMRRAGSTAVQIVALAVGLMALLLLTITQNDLLKSWHDGIAAEAPNRFVINIQPDQRVALTNTMQSLGLAAPTLLPMVRGRLIAVNNKAVSVDDYEGRARRLVDREFNLSYMTQPPPHNRFLEGRWFANDAQEISVEDGLMKELDLQLGDLLRFDIAGTEVEARISSRRKVRWDSFQVNFFVIFPESLLRDKPQSFITSFYMPPQRDVGPQLLAAFPNLTLIDTTTLLRQVRSWIDKVSSAVEFLFLFSLVAGLLVLYSALASTRDERTREAGILRALGASRQQLAYAQSMELILIGTLAGALASCGASMVGWAIARYVFEIDLPFNPTIGLIGIILGSVMAWAGGWLSLRRVLDQPPLDTLRGS